jgi:hypothetical protein
MPVHSDAACKTEATLAQALQHGCSDYFARVRTVFGAAVYPQIRAPYQWANAPPAMDGIIDSVSFPDTCEFSFSGK